MQRKRRLVHRCERAGPQTGSLPTRDESNNAWSATSQCERLGPLLEMPIPPAIRSEALDALFVMGGYNGLASVQEWVNQLLHNTIACSASAYSWRDTRSARRDILALPKGHPITLVGHSLGGGQAEILAEQLPAGTINNLITVGAYGPRSVDCRLISQKVGYWLNIVSVPDRACWQDMARNIAAPLLLRWKEQGFIPHASENHTSHVPHHDFYKMISERCGAVEKGSFKIRG